MKKGLNIPFGLKQNENVFIVALLVFNPGPFPAFYLLHKRTHASSVSGVFLVYFFPVCMLIITYPEGTVM